MKKRNALKVQGLIPLALLIVAAILLAKQGILSARNDGMGPLLIVPAVIAAVRWAKGLFIVRPDEARVLAFFGNYHTQPVISTAQINA